MERARELAQAFISFYVLSHALPLLLLLILIIYALVFRRKRRSIKVEPFMVAFIWLLVLMGFNQLRSVFQFWWPAVYGYALFDLIMIGMCFYTFHTFVDFTAVAKRYLTPADIKEMRRHHHQAYFYGQMHIQSTWVTHDDIENFTRGIAMEINDGKPDRLSEISGRLQRFTDFGADDESERYPLNKAVKWARAELATEIRSRNLEILVEELPTLTCFPNQIKWLFKEILLNVIKHNKEEQPCVVVFAEEMVHDWLIIFEDNGEGMRYTDQIRLFNLFKLDEDKRIDLTQGMGLAMCRKIMRIHRGHIWIDSGYYAGVSINLSIPKRLILNPRDIPEY